MAADFALLLLALFTFKALPTPARCQVFTNHFVAEVEGGWRVARNVAQQNSLRLMETNLFPNVYHFVNHRQPQLGRTPAWRTTRNLKSHDKVKFAEQQILRPRSLRNHARHLKLKWIPGADINFNEPFYPKLWYLHGRGFEVGGKPMEAVHLNVEPVWKQGLTGRGLTLFVLDDGLQAKNREIAPNFERVNSWDVSDVKHPLPSPVPRSAEDSHGTYCAAAMAAAANNSFCGVGVAFEAKVGAIRVLGKKALTDMQESLALSLWLSNADIVSASWGPRDNGKTVEGPKRLTQKALKDAVEKGRNGKGAIVVWAAGNGGFQEDNANLDGYASSIYTITIGALAYNGNSCKYSEKGASVLASVAVTGYALGMVGVSVVVPNLDGTCRVNFQGTSAAAPMAGGVIALLLEANPRLNWRDVQHLLAITSQKMGGHRDLWQTNGAGLNFNLQQGFGLINAEILVNAGRNWKNLPPQKEERVNFQGSARTLVENGVTVLKATVDESNIRKLEHVIVEVTIHHGQRGLLEIFLISPSGTQSQVLTTRRLDLSPKGFVNWPFMSVHFWGENPVGDWTLKINNTGANKGSVKRPTLVLYGH